MPIFSELYNPEKRRVFKVIRRSIVITTILFLIFGIGGYLSTLNFTTEIVVTRPSVVERDYMQFVACLAMIIVLVTKYLTMVMPFKANLYQLITGESSLMPQYW